MSRIYLIGDSVMKGVVYSEEKNKYSLCGGMRFPELEERGFEVCNLSKMGATIEKGYSILTNRLTGDHSSDLVILGYGGNDCNFDWKPISEDCKGEYSPYTPIEKFEAAYRKCISYARSLGAKVMLSALVPLDHHKFMRWISRGLSYDNILKWLGDESMLYRWHENYDRRVRRIAEEEGCETVDVRTPFLLSHNYKSLLCTDGIHPTCEGYRLVEQSITGAVKRVAPTAV